MDNQTIDVKEIAELEEEAIRRIEASNKTPQQQTYIKRLDTNRVVKTEQEYHFCNAKKIPVVGITYDQALSALKLEDSEHKALQKKKRKKKLAKASKKANRRG